MKLRSETLEPEQLFLYSAWAMQIDVLTLQMEGVYVHLLRKTHCNTSCTSDDVRFGSSFNHNASKAIAANAHPPVRRAHRPLRGANFLVQTVRNTFFEAYHRSTSPLPILDLRFTNMAMRKPMPAPRDTIFQLVR